ncbi:MAG: hypothetical protein Q8R10_20670 [Pseudomonas sp.]|uniref:hypothetical protein n=1 Tax=Pseudomonas sp. TaxID=306 RepID=UPI002733E78F|nr:hypothetical protein [Pseudomonas sp.]MDP3848835.1 hypothetical protein [Pseudomonas sp.]
MSTNPSENPYAVPTSNLQETAPTHQVPSIEEALSRGYDFRIGELLSDAWQRVKGSKGLIIGAVIIYAVAATIINSVFGAMLGLIGLQADPENLAGMLAGQFVISILGAAVTYPLLAGTMMIGIRRAADQPFNFDLAFSGFKNPLPIIITGVLMLVMVYVGFLLLLIPGIYLMIAYALALPLVIERGLSPWQALEASRKAISQHWFKVLGLNLVLGLIVGLSAIPLGIGMIWTVPLWAIASGVLYRTIFGVLPVAE